MPTSGDLKSGDFFSDQHFPPPAEFANTIQFAATLHILLINLVIIDDPLHFSNDL